jgi:hypothetical protein
VPTAVALGFGGVTIVGVTYQELSNPADAGPIVLRVASRSIGPLVVLVISWVVGELVGGLAVRRIVLGGSSVLGGIGRGVVDTVRHPRSLLVLPLVLTAILAIDIAAALAIVAIVLVQTRERLGELPPDPVASLLTVATLGAAWSLALIVTGLIGAWRAAAMTLAADAAIGRSRPSDASPTDPAILRA